MGGGTKKYASKDLQPFLVVVFCLDGERQQAGCFKEQWHDLTYTMIGSWNYPGAEYIDWIFS
jgi:hypothetical protein